MGFTLEVDDAGRVTGTWEGLVRVQDLLQSAGAVWSHERFGKKEVLWDLTRCTFEFSTEEIQAFAEAAKKSSVVEPGAKLAFVVPEDLHFGQTRMFESFRQDDRIRVQVFRSMEKAVAWLDTDS